MLTRIFKLTKIVKVPKNKQDKVNERKIFKIPAGKNLGEGVINK